MIGPLFKIASQKIAEAWWKVAAKKAAEEAARIIITQSATKGMDVIYNRLSKDKTASLTTKIDEIEHLHKNGRTPLCRLTTRVVCGFSVGNSCE